MLECKNISEMLSALEFDTVRTNKKVDYINLPCGFDIETTSIKNGESKAAFMYIWMFGIGHDNGVYYGRTWEELLETLQTVSDVLELGPDKRLVVYIHNLGYEFQFMRKYFNWVQVFAVDERKPIKAVCDLGIEFRDSYILSGFSLANTAKNLTKYKVNKAVGDLDYSLVRTHKTPLNDAEMGYCRSDISVITAYILEQIELYGDVTKIPTTNTGRVRKYVKDACYYSDSNHRKSSKSKYIKYRKIMNDLTIDPDTYVQLKRAFMGGFTHANSNYVGKTLTDVSSIDFTSSYPSVMVSEKFPMSRFKQVDIESLKMLDEYCAKYAMVFDIKFTNIKATLNHEMYISESKCYSLKGEQTNNGRIYSAELAATTITEIDYDIIKQCYQWDDIEIANVRYARKNYLPKSIVQSVLDLYQDKTVLKDVEGSEVEYLLSKGMLNSIYGMCVTDIVKDNATYDEDWGVDKVDLETEIEKYNTSKNRFLYYAWGVWVTAYARKNLWTGILATGDDYVYSDTDSLKVRNYDKYKDYTKWFDNQIMQKMYDMCDYYDLDKELLLPKTKEGKVKPLGVWDFEGSYNRFKTLGAKRYMTQSGERIQITVAGLSKQNGLNYMKEKQGGDIEGVFNMFDDSLYVPAENTGKMTHTYIDDEVSLEVVDYNGEVARINSMSGVHLEPCEFTLSIAQRFKQFLTQVSAGYIYKGVKHI